MAALNSNLVLRIISAVVVLTMCIAFLFYLPHPAPKIFFAGITIASIIEWALMIHRYWRVKVRYATWLIGGSAYIVLGIGGIYYQYQQSLTLFNAIILSIFLSDTAAYFIGRTLKGPKLAPGISPGKTWSGAVGALVMVTGYVIILKQYGFINLGASILIIALCPIGQAGDLIESAIKRQLKLKDSSQIIPGHGGILDRLDSVLLIGIALILTKF